MFKEQVNKLKKYCSDIIDDDDYFFDVDLNDIDYYKAFNKSGIKRLYSFAGSNLAILKTNYKNEDHVMLIFQIGLYDDSDQQNSQYGENGGGNKVSVKMKQVSEKINDIVARVESAFITFDYINCKVMREKEHKNVYVTILKKINDLYEDEFEEDI